MKRTMIALMLAAGLAAGLSAPAWADLGAGTAAYLRGDFANAYREFLAAGRQGVARAQFSLGLMYLRGQHVGRDYAKAVRWLRKAADQGDGEAYMVLGDLHMRDIPSHPLLRDYVKSYMWLTLALAKVRGTKRRTALALRTQVAARMIQQQIDRASRMAREWRALER